MYGRRFARWEKTYVGDGKTESFQRMKDNGCFKNRNELFSTYEHDPLSIMEEPLWDKEEEAPVPPKPKCFIWKNGQRVQIYGKDIAKLKGELVDV